MIEEKLSKLKNFTLLLVDDDDELLNKLNIILSIFFKKVITASNGEDALCIFEKQNIDMIISDYTMPNMDGHELFKAVRKINKNIPLVIISNYSDSEKLLKSIPLSLANYLIKPVDYTTLTTTLLEMIEKLEDNVISTYIISDELVYDKTKRELIENNIVVPLSKSEIVTLELLLQNKNKILPTHEIELNLDPIENKSNQAIKSLIYRLRKKIGKDKILNIPGFGYILKLDNSLI
jgi:two-component system, OmpR family, response regulator VanR